MRVTVDANILFACLIKDSVARRLFFNPALTLFSPEFIVDELMGHIINIQEESGLKEEDLHQLIRKVFDQLIIIHDKDLKPFLPAAASLIRDPEDWLYLSCALREDTAIWSNDNDFGFQRRVRIFTTKELAAVVGML